MTLVALEGVRKSYDGRTLLGGIDFTLGDEERVGLVGPNGSGKSTILRSLAGSETPDAGARVLRRELRLGYLEQEPVLDPEHSGRAAVRAGLVGRERVLADLERTHTALETSTGVDMERQLARQARLEEELERLGGHDVEHKIELFLQALGLSDFEARCGSMSGGERRRVALARLLISAPELLLLDEPTNHLDAFAIDWLEDWLLETRTPILIVTHDRYLLDRVCDRIVELDRTQLYSYPGSYGDYLETRADRLAAESKAEGVRVNLLRRETAWMRRGPPARTTKAKARIRRYGELAGGAPLPMAADLELQIPPGPRLGTRVVTLKGISKRFGERVVVPKLDLEVLPGQRLGLVGPNGAGKTTLLRMILGELTPDSGTREIGATVRFAGMDQERGGLALDQTATEAIAGKGDVVASGGRVVRVEGYLERFGLGPVQQRSRVRDLSGGERARLQLARLCAHGGNVLVLDEPTNDLDLNTLRALEEALLCYEGAVLIVSHDRWFLDRVATQVLYLDGQGGARMHHGDLSALMADLARERAARRAAEVAARAAPPSSSKATPKKRISSYQQKELAQVEARIPQLEAELAALDERLADPTLYTGSAPRLIELRTKRIALAAELAKTFARWEELEALRA